MVLQTDGILEGIYLGLLRGTGIDQAHEFLWWFGGGGGAQVLLVLVELIRSMNFSGGFGAGTGGGAQVLLLAPWN